MNPLSGVSSNKKLGRQKAEGLVETSRADLGELDPKLAAGENREQACSPCRRLGNGQPWAPRGEVGLHIIATSEALRL